MKSSHEGARRWVLRELDRRVHQHGPAAIEANTNANAAVKLEGAAAQKQAFAK